MRYGPIGRLVTMYAPSAPVTAVRTASVSVWINFTCAPGIAAPVLSWIVPDTWDVEVACVQAANATPTKHAKIRIDLTVISPLRRTLPKVTGTRTRTRAHL